ncbi:S8 family serine peptidase [Pyxidicoccus fallax]|uniref:S8 family serine peptidase n=1 Tax=Pyxidicoccus fallax TaxID=394095 RepID=A0A848M068_9BACT|nr:S8 family peptidase [Pyxidicoccus fallax]NMO22784.1 S8 family serine peptidase [Pyxidicoccus fallax]NPC83855.1 S8 family serine peptidase [Pyxidicoccus fallax]
MTRLLQYSRLRSMSAFRLPGVRAGFLAAALVLGCGERPAPPPPAPMAAPERTHVEGEVLVRFRDGVQAMESDASRVLVGARVMHRFRSLTGLQHVKLPQGTTVEQALEHYRRDPRVAFAEPNYLYTLDALSDDARFRELWGLHNTGQTLGGVDVDLNAPEAWALTQGSEADVVAVIDTGIDFTHPDLAPNMWANPGEVAGNGVDDDGNGYVDDIHGIDAMDEARTKPPMDNHGHGTHVAGTIAARGDNALGVVGVSPRTKLLACKVADDEGLFSLDAAIRCLDYLAELKTRERHPVNVIATNNSWSGSQPSESLEEAITRHLHAGILFVASAGNTGYHLDLPWATSFPSEYLLPNLISVGATDASDRRASFSAYGRQKVDVFAPGVSILSTVPRGGYAVYSGTSMAAPHVTGLVALLHAQAPERDWRALRNLVLSGGQEVPGLRHLSVTGRRIRAVDTGGVGSLSCENQALMKRLEPGSDVVLGGQEWWNDSEGQVTLAALNIRCGEAAGPVTVQLDVEPFSIVLRDDGQGPDRAAGDGIATAVWTHSRLDPVTFTFPDGDTVTAYPRYAAVPRPFEISTTWRPRYGRNARFQTDIVTAGTQGPWEVQWDLDYDGRFDVDVTQTQAPPETPTQRLTAAVLYDSPPRDAEQVAVRILDASGRASFTVGFPPDYNLVHPHSVKLESDVLVPQVNHPFTLDVSFIAPADSHPWTVEWDLDHDGQTFRPTETDVILTPAEQGSSKSLGRLVRTEVFSRQGVNRVAMRITTRDGHPSLLKTWGAAAVCGPPFLRDVSVEGSGTVEPVTVGLVAQAEPGCEPILRYHWDFDGDGRFDAVTAEPSIQHVYADNPVGGASQRGMVRVESAGGHLDRTFEVPVENAPPSVEPIPEQTVTSTTVMMYQVRASDPAGAGDALTYSLSGIPGDWVSVSETGLLSWSAPKAWLSTQGARARFEVVVRDDEGAEARVPVVLLADLEPEPIPTSPVVPGGSKGCSATGGGLPAALALLAFLPWVRGRRRYRS